MKKITPHLWFDNHAEEAVNFYSSVFKNINVEQPTHYDEAGAKASGMPEGSVMTIPFELAGQSFVALNGGPVFKLNPSISFILNFDPSKEKNARAYLDDVWKKLSAGGTPLMPLDKYPFSERYGWIQDKFGISWQLILSDPEGEERPFVVPSILFVGDVYGKAEEAIRFYTSIFKNSKVGDMHRYGANQPPDKEGAIMFADFALEGQWFAAMDSAREHDFTFNEAISFMVNCKNQEEVDHFWSKLSAAPESEQCGWLKDKYGVSWQIVPAVLPELLSNEDKEKSGRVMKAMLQMKKLDIRTLEHA